MMRNVMLAMSGAVVAVTLGHYAELYQFSDPQALVAAVIGGALALIASGRPVEPSFVRRTA